MPAIVQREELPKERLEELTEFEMIETQRIWKTVPAAPKLGDPEPARDAGLRRWQTDGAFVRAIAPVIYPGLAVLGGRARGSRSLSASFNLVVARRW